MSVYHIVTGDCRTVLRQMRDCSVHCVVTSPPYWGLRDYKIAGQCGLEPKFEDYIAQMVEIFREVRRVLRKDGTLWLNLGSSYASGDMSASQSRGRERALAYDSDGKELPNLTGSGRACPDCGGELLACSLSHRGRTAGNSQPSQQAVLLSDEISRNISNSVCSDNEMPPPAVFSSTTVSLCENGTDADAHASMVLASPLGQPTSSDDVPQSARSSACTSGIEQNVRPSDSRKWDTAFVCTACGYSTRMYPTFKTKDLINLPFFVAEALRADGWYLRSAMPWLKTNPMPESCEDRPGSAVEYVFLLSKSKSYYYDRVAVMRPMKQIKSLGRNFRNTDLFLDSLQYPYGLIADAEGDPLALHISTLPLREAHFATFPPALIEPCILAGCPAQCCAKCGAPWERETERTAMVIDRSERTHDLGHTRSSGTMLKPATTTTTGWAPSCSCHADTSPGLVLDPFAGAGTTGLVATRLGRNSLMIELNPEYVEIAKRRIENDQLNQAYKKTSKAMNGQHAG